jgi:adenylate cyclase
MREEDEALAASSPYVAEALEREKREGHRFAVIARTAALGIVFCLLPILNWHPSVLFYQAIVLLLIGLGWLQLRLARASYSRAELALIYLDLIVMTLIFVVPNPAMPEPVPNAFLFSFDSFSYFFIILATATLAYSWRTVWMIGTQVAILWTLAVVGVALFGRQVPELTAAVQQALPTYPGMAADLDPNSVRPALRLQEIVVFVIVAAILAVKGYRSNRLLIRQASLAEERANLSRYFPSSIVDTLASAKHDIGAVRSQNIAILFTDIVGFTKLAAVLSPTEVMDLLRQYHSMVERAIFDNDGTLDKYLGDGVMATFGTPIPGDRDAANALAAGQQIIARTKAWNVERERRGEAPIEVSVGIHYGPAVMGDIGPERRLEFAVVGDTVNIASRIEAATRNLGCRLAASDDLMAQTGLIGMSDSVIDLELRPKIRLKGRSAPMDLWVDG